MRGYLLDTNRSQMPTCWAWPFIGEAFWLHWIGKLETSLNPGLILGRHWKFWFEE